MVSAYFLDTSALVKRYIDETGSVWLRANIDPVLRPFLVISQLLVVEVHSALNRRLREGTISQGDYTRTKHAFQDDCQNEYNLIPISEAIVDLACDLLERHPLRASDAIHLATALTSNRLLSSHGLPAFTFLCADDRLINAATAERLAADNPNHHL
jgi:predicted nucleic acid-binding protein